MSLESALRPVVPTPPFQTQAVLPSAPTQRSETAWDSCFQRSPATRTPAPATSKKVSELRVDFNVKTQQFGKRQASIKISIFPQRILSLSGSRGGLRSPSL